MGAPAGTGPTAPGPHLDPATGSATFIVTAVPGVRPVRVWFHLREFGADPLFRRRGRFWAATLPPPPVDRLEYLLVVRDAAGTDAMVLDPGNPVSAPGPFGDHSVLTWPDYVEPAWLRHPPGRWAGEPVPVDTGDLPVAAQLWTPLPAPSSGSLLVVHDGPEYARLCRLLDHLDALADDGAPRCRVLSLQPVSRDDDYSANPAYADTLVTRVLPAARELAAGTSSIVGVGASLGALALLHAAVRHPGTFDGLFLQSGSFFLPEYDAHEKRFAHYDRVVEFVAGFDADPGWLTGLRVALTAGLGEENLENNRALAARLRGHGVPTTLAEGRDGHNHVAWRDLLAPSLGELLSAVTT